MLFARCDLISHICLDNCAGVKDEAVEALARNCPELKSVRLAWCVGVGDRGMMALASCRATRKLEWLDITACRRISDAGVMAITEHCQRLRKLSVSAVRRVTDTAAHVCLAALRRG